jgi:hypothetical protein
MFERFDIAIDFEIDIENVRNTRYRDHGGNSMKRNYRNRYL